MPVVSWCRFAPSCLRLIRGPLKTLRDQPHIPVSLLLPFPTCSSSLYCVIFPSVIGGWHRPFVTSLFILPRSFFAPLHWRVKLRHNSFDSFCSPMRLVTPSERLLHCPLFPHDTAGGR